MSAALNRVKTFRPSKWGDLVTKTFKTSLFSVVKSSSYNSQIKDVLKSAAPDWAPPPNERRIRRSENLKSAAALKRVNTVYIYSEPPWPGIFFKLARGVDIHY
jgi:hypothetical protein